MKTSALKTLLVLAFISFVGISYSQPMGPPPKDKGERQQEKNDNIESMKIAYLTTTEIYTHLDRDYLKEAIIRFHPRS